MRLINLGRRSSEKSPTWPSSRSSGGSTQLFARRTFNNLWKNGNPEEEKEEDKLYRRSMCELQPKNGLNPLSRILVHPLARGHSAASAGPAHVACGPVSRGFNFVASADVQAVGTGIPVLIAFPVQQNQHNTNTGRRNAKKNTVTSIISHHVEEAGKSASERPPRLVVGHLVQKNISGSARFTLWRTGLAAPGPVLLYITDGKIEFSPSDLLYSGRSYARVTGGLFGGTVSPVGSRHTQGTASRELQ
ncbi:hypothetical protein DFH07DRAFT_778837 [Mycena maculata]|uniref:Uncharacterized protein n=1 Tax=Mycena maculata TaxID=230809 RepID=A0AAD7ID03_9AGAR|nr:hypothetical protein DFH07DRAFT_778837 [Mycena maculata]